MQIEFEWAISEPNARGLVQVRERLCGSDLIRHTHFMPKRIAEQYIQIRREFVHRTVTTKLQAIQIFQPRQQGTLQ